MMIKSALLYTSLIFWLLGMGIGADRLLTFENTPGTMLNSPKHWVLDSEIPCDPKRPTLVMLVHPRCPCSHASLAELDRLMALCHQQVTAYVLFVVPNSLPRRWTDSRLRCEAAAIPGVHVFADPDGFEANRLHAKTSGETLLYAPSGLLLYHGGLTGSRGHEGDNAGLDAVVSLLISGRSNRQESPVFGCPLAVSSAGLKQERTQKCRRPRLH